ncbi:mechanosensitive ion channel family protein [Candidatus Saccharibacteria bacterium]|nr:mechanosensitive ion channel family protein [Candidatus Saccharibacteria bacterium]
MDFLKGIIENIWVERGFWTAVVILFSLFIYRSVTRVLTSREKKASKIMSSKKNKTIIRMLKSIIAGALSIVTALMVLQIYGVNVNSMLAGVGIVSIVVGFALQDSLKDIIRGFVIISDNYYEIGDVINYGNNVGPVISISLLTTKIQDINTMNTVSIANRNIDKVEINPGYIYIPVPLPYKVEVEDAEVVMHEITKKVSKLDSVKDVKYQGINDLTPNSQNYQFYVIASDPANTLQTRRDCLKIIITTLNEHKISIPRDQLDIYSK